MQNIITIAVDGPAGAGKSTVAKAVAEAAGAVYLDTGAMYRAVGLYMARRGITEPEDIVDALKDCPLSVRFEDGAQHMYLADEDVTGKIRSPEAAMMASRVSAIPGVRTFLVALQQDFARGHSVVMDGRDIGTVVLPDATLKSYLTASCEVRAQRRFAELQASGSDRTYDEVLRDIIDRDYNDSSRAASPMRPAEDAVIVDSSNLTREQVVEKVIGLVREAAAEKGVEMP